MDRSTERIAPGKILIKGFLKAARENLASYEDTGLTPEVCAEYRKFEDEAVASGMSFGEVVELMHKKQDGRIVVLPCKVGQTIYKANKASRKVNPWVVNAIYFSSKTELIIEAGRGANHFTLGMFGKTVFLARDEAEKALGKAQDER